MQFRLSEEQILLLDNVNRFLDDNSPLDRVRAYADGGDDADIWAGLTELGVPALLIPEAQGVLDLSHWMGHRGRVLGRPYYAVTLSRHCGDGANGIGGQRRQI